MLVLVLPGVASAGKLSWLDDLVQEVIVEAKAGGKGLVRGGDGARTEIRRVGRLFVTHEADETLEQLVRRSDELARAGRRIEQPTEALLQARFSRLLKQDTQTLRAFEALQPAEKRLVVELGETAQILARRYPREAETMVRRLGPEGLTAVRVFGDDVAEVLVKEGPESLGVLRKTGRGGWSFFTKQVLPHKKKLAAAGILAAFMANPEKFVDYAGQATEFAVRRVCQGRRPARLGGRRRSGAWARDHNRSHARRLWTRLPRVSLPRHGTGRSGRGALFPRCCRAADPLDVPAVRLDAADFSDCIDLNRHLDDLTRGANSLTPWTAKPHSW